MTVRELIEYVDRMRPNDFPVVDKILWINELESMIQTADYLIHPDDIVFYLPDGEWEMTGVYFPDELTMVLPKRIKVSDYATVEVSGLETYAANNGSFTVRGVDQGGKMIFRLGDAFPAVGETPDTGTAKIVCKLEDVELLLPEAFQHLYWYYLFAMIDNANQEYDRYENSHAAFNRKYTAFKKWYTTHYPNRGCH